MYLHQFQGCSSPLVVKFADTQKDKDLKRQQQMMSNIWNMSSFSNLGLNSQYIAAVSFTILYC